MPLDWNKVMRRYQENPETETINRKKVTIARVTASSVHIHLPSGEQSVSRKNLERAVEMIEGGYESLLRPSIDVTSRMKDPHMLGRSFMIWDI